MKNTPSTIAVWLDQQEAMLLDPLHYNGEAHEIESGIESHVRIHGEGGDGTRVGRFRSGNNEFRKHRREEQQVEAYLGQVLDSLAGYDRVLLCGPGTLHRELHNHMEKDPRFRGKEVLAETVGPLTEQQLLALLASRFPDKKH